MNLYNLLILVSFAFHKVFLQQNNLLKYIHTILLDFHLLKLLIDKHVILYI